MIRGMAGEGDRIVQLDGVRGIAIAMVFIHHTLSVHVLWMGVDLFFVLSGFLITGILFNNKEKPFRSYIGAFYARRVRRILPPYAIVLLIVTVLISAAWLKYWYMYIGAMNFVSAFQPGLAAPLPLWSLAVEEQFYLLWPLAVYYLNRKQLIRCAVLLLALAPSLRFVCTPLFAREYAVYMLLPFRMDTMAAGALIALLWPELRVRLRESRSVRERLIGACTGLLLLSVVCLAVLSRYGLSPSSNKPVANFGVYECTLGICTSCFLFALAGVGRKLLSAWPLLWLGRISYSFYLIHIPMMIWSPHSKFWLPLAGSLLFSVAMWFWVEKPILSFGRKPPAAVISTKVLQVAE